MKNRNSPRYCEKDEPLLCHCFDLEREGGGEDDFKSGDLPDSTDILSAGEVCGKIFFYFSLRK